MMETAYDSVRDSYEIEDLREIVEHGCQSGCANQHIYYHQTLSFFDNYEDEIIDYIGDTLGSEINEQLWIDNSCNITGYKNDTTWCFIELVASQLIDEYESSNSQSNLAALSNTEWGKSHLEVITV